MRQLRRPGGVMHRLILAALISVLALTLPASAQTTTATAQGTVRDQDQAVLPGATVTVRNVQTGFVRTTVTDDRGAYSVTFLPPGLYEIVVELSGFRTERREGLRFE